MGETTTKDVYDWSTYKYGSDWNKLTKYCDNSACGLNGFTDGKTTLEAADDAANANWGGTWRMPSFYELTELSTKCTWIWTTLNGVNGYKVTFNGNSIFIPATGIREGTNLSGEDSQGCYWSSSLQTLDPELAYRLNFDAAFHSVNSDYSDCYMGRSVRSVCP